ncbi:MAG: AmmeMemoRadiSam system protein A [Candidatus Omnitrophota bacterium]
MLNDKQKKRLLEIARSSIQEFLTKKCDLKITEHDPVLNTHKGAFVTITLNGKLRGCIGHITSDRPLYQTVSEMAVSAAVSDPRFSPLTGDEINRIQLEISVLSELEKITEPEKIIVGQHGILIRKGFYSGLLLPQVAVEYNWTREEFLEHTCFKAGLDKDDWKKDVDIYIFSAEVFGEPCERISEVLPDCPDT